MNEENLQFQLTLQHISVSSEMFSGFYTGTLPSGIYESLMGTGAYRLYMVADRSYSGRCLPVCFPSAGWRDSLAGSRRPSLI